MHLGWDAEIASQAGFSLQRTLWCLQVSCTAKGTPDVLLGDGPGRERRGGRKQERNSSCTCSPDTCVGYSRNCILATTLRCGVTLSSGILSLGTIDTVCVLVAQSCLTLCVPVDCSPPGSSVHGISQARLLDWVAILFSRDLLNPGSKHRSPAPQVDSLPSEPREAHARSFFAVWDQAALWDILAASLARWPKCPLLVVKTENVSRICQMFPGDRITPAKSQCVILIVQGKEPQSQAVLPTVTQLRSSRIQIQVWLRARMLTSAEGGEGGQLFAVADPGCLHGRGLGVRDCC